VDLQRIGARNPRQRGISLRRRASAAAFWLYNLRHTHASRLSAAGVSDLFVTQMIGHSTPSILQKYSKAIDEYRRDAIRKLEQMRAAHTRHGTISGTIN